ncbi:MAG: TIGR00725 family protein [Methanobacteriota archaeon]|nr:MAG: TIGR00725 family protein [Euryarchaeota archaeon]
MLQIGVIGSGDAEEGEERAAEQVGREIARAGHILLCGGRGGVMEAAARGARSEGGLTVGILPGPYREEANPHIAVAIATDMGHARNAIIARSADALIAVGGGAGTLSEIALGLKMGRPVITIEDAPPRLLISSEGIYHSRSPQEAVKLAEDMAQKTKEE